MGCWLRVEVDYKSEQKQTNHRGQRSGQVRKQKRLDFGDEGGSAACPKRAVSIYVADCIAESIWAPVKVSNSSYRTWDR